MLDKRKENQITGALIHQTELRIPETVLRFSTHGKSWKVDFHSSSHVELFLHVEPYFQ